MMKVAVLVLGGLGGPEALAGAAIPEGSGGSCGAGRNGRVADPVAEFRLERGLGAEDALMRWTADINGDGHPEIFLSGRAAYLEDKRDGQTPSWLIYIAAADGAGYRPSAGVEEAGEKSPVLAQINLETLFIGRISQLKTRGIVTARSQIARSGKGTTEVYAYTVEGGDLKRTPLAEFDQEDEGNAVFDQYLGKGRRTAVQLREIQP